MKHAKNIHAILSGKLSTYAAGKTPAIPVKWENVVSEPSAGLYLREWLLLSTPRAAGLGNTAPNYVRGVYQIDVVSTLTGWGAAYDMADGLAVEFKRGTYLTMTGVRLTCESVMTGPAIRQDSKYVLPVSITFYAYVGV